MDTGTGTLFKHILVILSDDIFQITYESIPLKILYSRGMAFYNSFLIDLQPFMTELVLTLFQLIQTTLDPML